MPGMREEIHEKNTMNIEQNAENVRKDARIAGRNTKDERRNA